MGFGVWVEGLAREFLEALPPLQSLGQSFSVGGLEKGGEALV